MPDPDPVPTPPRARNNTRQIETVSRNRQLVRNVLADDEALTLAAKRGRTEDVLTAGLPLADAYLTEFGARDAATGTQTGARQGLKAAGEAARAAYADLRSTLRTQYDGQTHHLETLGVADDHAPRDRDVFLDAARSTLAAARKAPYAADLDGVGYTERDLDAVEEKVDALETAASGKTSATGAHGGSTAERNAAYRAFMDWMTPTRRWLALAFKAHPHVARRVGLTPAE